MGVAARTTTPPRQLAAAASNLFRNRQGSCAGIGYEAWIDIVWDANATECAIMGTNRVLA